MRSILYSILVGLIVAVCLGGIVRAENPASADDLAAAPQIYQNASFTVNYNPASCGQGVVPWPDPAQAAMNHVADILDDVIADNGTIVIDICLKPDTVDTLAAAGPTNFVEQCASGGGALPVANTAYPVALANARCGADQNGDQPEISASVNSVVTWNYCTTNCAWDNPNQFDFVSTLLHELLHGLGWVDNIVYDNNGTTAIDGTPNIFTRFLACNGDTANVCTDGQLLTDIAAGKPLGDALQVGNGKLSFTGPNSLAAFAGEFANVAGIRGPFVFAPNPYQQGSSVSHWGDDNAANLGRMMNAATGAGPSSRVVDAITLMSLKDLGWTVLESSDFSDGTLASYGTARHYNAAGIVNHSFLGETVTFEGTPARSGLADAGNDGVIPGTWADGPQQGRAAVTVANVPGCLNGWVDWNGDGDFSDTSEQVVPMRFVTAGNNDLLFDVPGGQFPGDGDSVALVARFRLVPDWDGDGTCNDQVAIQSAGAVFGGEVEDYQWTFTSAGVPVASASFKVYMAAVLRN